MIEVKHICDRLVVTNSRIEKENILRENADNEKFKRVLRFLLDNNITTGLSAKKIDKAIAENPAYSLAITNFVIYFTDNFTDFLDYLSKNNTGSNDMIIMTQEVINSQPEDVREFCKSVVTKSLKLGVDKKTANKVYGDFIKSIDVMLGVPLENCKPLPQGTWFSLSHKLNGDRGVFIDGEFRSRAGLVYGGLNHIKTDIEKIFPSNLVIDGELLYKNKEGLSDSDAFQKGSGIVNSDAPSKPEIKFVIFDAIPRDEFINGKSSATYSERKHELEWIRPLIADMENIEIVEFLYEGTDQAQIEYWLNKCETDLDWEGVMLNLDVPYVCKRTDTLRKVKRFFDVDLRVIDVNIADSGKYLGVLKSISCQFGQNIVKIGSGFDDQTRILFAQHPEEIVGKIVKIKYKKETTNKKGQKSLQFATYQGIRYDKTEADY